MASRNPSATVVRSRSSRIVRGAADPQSGSEPPGQRISRVWPKPCSRRPWLIARPRTHSASPSRSNSPMARGVSPSPQVLSRGKTAASARVTSNPDRAAQAAAAEPAGPAPTTSTSVRAGTLTDDTSPDAEGRAAAMADPAPVRVT